jgi:hypothetical protein
MRFGSIPPAIGATITAVIGYGVGWWFIFLAYFLPRKDDPAYVIGSLLANFEVIPFAYLIILGPPALGFGWALIFLLAYFRRRIIFTASIAALGIQAYLRVTRNLGRAITSDDVSAGLHYFADPLSRPFYFYTVPLMLVLLGLVVLAFRPRVVRRA